jgi:hypothetical protein
MNPQITQINRRNLWMVFSYWLAVITLLPIAFTSFIWLQVVHGVTSRAIDGSGHFAVAQIYDQSIFPETFGWTNAYFSGMPFPNFYPPLFFWLVSLLHHTHLFSFATAFKLVIALPLIVLPLATWAIAYFHTEKNSKVAFGAAIASATLYTLGEIFQPNTGLDMSSTLLDGFYTQPLGFVLLLLWMLVYLLPQHVVWRFALSAVLLALTVLANFFNAITATIFIVSVLAYDLWCLFRATNTSERRKLRNTLLLHFASPWLALALTAFWMAPMLSSYEYLVTRPLIRPLGDLVTPPVWCWYFLAAVGAIVWLRRPFGRLAPYLITCLILLLSLVFAGSFAPTWFPLQVFRFFSTVNSLVCVPIGISIAYAVDLYLGKKPRSELRITTGKAIAFSVITLVALIALAIAMSSKRLTQAFAFYTPETVGFIAPVLEFGKSHRDGRYLVEVLPSRTPSGPVRADSLALNAYLGSQGNETISIVYREASPNSSFFNAELNAFSPYKENFGISSTLMDDKDFINQPLSQHLKRLEFIGVRYLVIGTAEMKQRLAREPGLTRHEVGAWTIFQLQGEPFRYARALQYRPALVVSDFTVKLRRQDQYDFVRLAEEQFNDTWFDVLLVRAPERKLDLIRDLDKFGALIVERYAFQDENNAFARLKEFAHTRPLILISSESPLFVRIKSALNEFPRAVVIERIPETMSDWVEAVEPSHSYDSSSIRSVWRAVRAVLDKEKVRFAGDVQAQVEKNLVRLNSSEKNVPVVIAQTYNPKWVRNDREAVYAATPFFTVTFIDQPTQLLFERSRLDRIALWISLFAFVGIVGLVGFSLRNRRIT